MLWGTSCWHGLGPLVLLQAKVRATQYKREYWVITFILWWNISIMIEVVSTRVTMHTSIGREGSLNGLMSIKTVWIIWCGLYSHQISTEHLLKILIVAQLLRFSVFFSDQHSKGSWNWGMFRICVSEIPYTSTSMILSYLALIQLHISRCWLLHFSLITIWIVWNPNPSLEKTKTWNRLNYFYCLGLRPRELGNIFPQNVCMVSSLQNRVEKTWSTEMESFRAEADHSRL